ncbi:MAG: HAMP domain-containing protein [Acidobacteria bacterium]|nr:HAMP domain-containing protein [Acidobacteriota bacterium]
MALRQFVSRISVRLLAFNVLLVFLPLFGVFFLDEYERRLEDSLDRSLVGEAEVLAAALSGDGAIDQEEARRVIARFGPERLARLRVVDADRVVIADSRPADVHAPSDSVDRETRGSVLYKLGAALTWIPRTMFGSTELLLQPADYYEASTRMQGPEVQAAFRGELGRKNRTTAGGARSVTLYRAAPVRRGDEVVGVVLATQTTQRMLQDLYVVRLGIARVTVISLTVAAVLSLWIAATMVRPISRLRREAGEIVDRRGRLRGKFTGSDRLDELGDLSRALETLTSSLERHIRFIESFSADVSHEFKNPLASIRTATEMLQLGDDQASRERFLRIIQQEVARMEGLLSGIREVTQLDAELPGEAREEVAVGDVVGQVVDGIGLRAGDRVTIRYQRPDPDPRIRVARDRLAQVVENLLDNAAGFSTPGGAIDVNVAAEDATVVITVADSGPGIPDEHLGRIFERFFSYRPGEPRGTGRHVGLGLSIVKTIVDGYGGTIAVSNRAEGGATFEVRLPKAK